LNKFIDGCFSATLCENARQYTKYFLRFSLCLTKKHLIAELIPLPIISPVDDMKA